MKQKLDLSKIIIEKINPKTVSKDFWEKYHILNEKRHRELYPDDSLLNRATLEQSIKIGWLGYHKFHWNVFKDETKREIIADSIAAYVTKDAPNYAENKDNSYFYILVDSDYYRQGLGKLLLKIATEVIKKHGCKFMETNTMCIPGKEFCTKYGAKLVNEFTKNRLAIKNIDWKLVQNWIKEVKANAPGVKLEEFSIVPEKDIVEISKLETILEMDMPALEEDNKWVDVFTPEKRRKEEKRWKELGRKKHIIISREENGIISGYTEITYSEIDQPGKIRQGLTGVLKEYRGRGLGKFLKAQMLLYIKENIKYGKYIRTGNADHNIPMMKINEKLGFKPFILELAYKFVTEELSKILEK
ncbi:MAG: GNAT family N-acetyltransferase [Candidatus Heimdallarchaeota archaeon]